MEEQVSNSLRAINNSFSISRDVVVDERNVFSRSLRAEDDEEALKWAALERLPTFSRVKKGLLKADDGQTNEVDVLNLGYKERKNLVERLVRDTEEDNEIFLLKLKQRLDRQEIFFPIVSLCRVSSLMGGQENISFPPLFYFPPSKHYLLQISLIKFL
ncbi:hypothetical protein SLA2020_400110 [Shorea laevis]